MGKLVVSGVVAAVAGKVGALVSDPSAIVETGVVVDGIGVLGISFWVGGTVGVAGTAEKDDVASSSGGISDSAGAFVV